MSPLLPSGLSPTGAEISPGRVQPRLRAEQQRRLRRERQGLRNLHLRPVCPFLSRSANSGTDSSLAFQPRRRPRLVRRKLLHLLCVDAVRLGVAARSVADALTMTQPACTSSSSTSRTATTSASTRTPMRRTAASRATASPPHAPANARSVAHTRLSTVCAPGYLGQPPSCITGTCRNRTSSFFRPVHRVHLADLASCCSPPDCSGCCSDCLEPYPPSIPPRRTSTLVLSDQPALEII